jgi:D-tyrosyl-tRNA(Tyr) deacylase
MRAVIQRVSQARLTIEGVESGAMGPGLVVLAGVETGDGQEDVDWLARKIVQMRLFADEQGAMNRSLTEVEGSLMCVSQFTLLASTKKGNRPSFLASAKPEASIPLYEALVEGFRTSLPPERIITGRFGAHMEVSLTNDGPVTIVIDSRRKA